MIFAGFARPAQMILAERPSHGRATVISPPAHIEAVCTQDSRADTNGYTSEAKSTERQASWETKDWDVQQTICEMSTIEIGSGRRVEGYRGQDEY